MVQLSQTGFSHSCVCVLRRVSPVWFSVTLWTVDKQWLCNSFKGQFPSTVITKCWLYSPCCNSTSLSRLIPNCLHLPHPQPSTRPAPTNNHQLVLCESAFIVIVTSLLFVRFYTQMVSYSIYLSLTYFTQHNALQVHPYCCK